MPISLVLDIIISGLLVLTIAYAVRLNQRLSQLRSDKNELLKLARTFAEATVRAEVGIQNLKVSSEALQAEVSKAATLKDDLSYLVERGGRSADEMVANVRPRGRDSAPHAKQSRTHGQDEWMGKGQGAATAHAADPEARLIEDAIRAATPGRKQGQNADQGPDRGDITRRIAGRPATSGKGPGTLATRGLGHGVSQDISRPNADEDAIEDTQAARALLEALSSVK